MTIPLVLGDVNARLVVAGGVAGWTGFACWFWGVGLAGWKVSSLSWLAGAVMVGNFFRDRTREGDSLSWRLFPVWLLGLFVLPMHANGVSGAI